MGLGGGLLGFPLCSESVLELGAEDNFPKQFGRVEAPELGLGHAQHLEDHRGGVAHLLEALGGISPKPQRGKR